MAKPKKKPTPKAQSKSRASSAAHKTAKAAAKKPVKAAAPEKKAAKPTKAAAPAKTPEPKAQDKKAAKPAKAGKASDKKNKKAKGMEEDDFLPEASEGAEELPDLSEFEETEEVVEETDDGVELDSDGEAPVPNSDEEIILTDAEGRRYCKVKECDQIASVEGYCRYHYLLLWKKIQVRRKILVDGKLERYVEELTSRYPDKFLEMIRRDLKTEKDFLSAIAELEIDESAIDNEFEDEAQTFIDEVRGVTEAGMSEEEEF